MKFIKSDITKDNIKLSGYSNSTISSSGSSASGGQASSLEPHKLWGQLFDGTKDISGDMTDVGKIIATDDISTQGDFIIKQLDDEGKEVEGGDLNISVDGTAAKFSGKETYEFDGKIKAPNGEIDTLVSKTAAITTLATENITNADTIKTKNLEVTGSAHFFELIIDKIKASGGAALFTPADGFEIDIVESVTDGYKLYWQCQDGDGNQRDNMWKVNDQAICQSFNRAKVGTSYNVSNKYYWSLVTEVSDNANPILKDGEYYNYIVISTTTYDGEVNPEKGDSIAMLGYRGTDDEKRQSAIYISAYTSLDSGLTAPLLAQYKGINDFKLETHRKSYFDATGAKFVGNFEVSSGEDIEDYINKEITDNTKNPYIGTDGYWYTWDVDKQDYVKSDTKAEGTEGHSPYIGSDGYWYSWDADKGAYVKTSTKAQGEDGTDGHSPYIYGGYWYVWSASSGSYIKTSTKAEGTDGTDGHTPYISNGYWYSWNSSSQSYVNTGVKAVGTDGKDGEDGKDGQDYPLIKLNSGSANGGWGHWEIVQNGAVTYSRNIDTYALCCKVFDMTSSLTDYYANLDTTDPDTLANWLTSNYTDAKYLITIIAERCTTLTTTLADVLYQYGCPTKLSAIAYSANGSWTFMGYHYGNDYETYLRSRGVFSYNPKGGTAIQAYIINGKLYGTDNSSTYSLQTNIDGLTSVCTSIQNNMVTQSILQQKSDSILAAVNDTYLKIGDSNITLNGDTNINGSLTLNATNQGFIINGSGGITEISPKSVGTYSNFVSKSSVIVYSDVSKAVSSSNKTGSGYYNFSWEASQNLGKFAYGSTITFSNFTQYVYGKDSKTLTAASGTLTVYQGSTTKATYSISATTKSTLGSITVTSSSSDIKVVASFSASYLESDCSTEYIKGHIDVKTTWQNTCPTSNGYTLIGYDGIGCSFGNGKNIYLGTDGFIANQDPYKFQVTTSGIYQNARRNVYVLNSTTSYTVTDPIDTIIATGSGDRKILFPGSPYVGQVIRIYDKTSGNCYLYPNGHSFVYSGDTQPTSDTVREVGGNMPWEYVFANNYWYEAMLG